jgi:hypothetical protein
MIEKQFTLYLENKPGVLAAMTTRLAKAKVNIEGISVAESTDVAIVQLVVNKAQVAARTLKEARIPYTVQNVALVHLTNKPGSLAELVARIARFRVHINYVYATGRPRHNGSDCYAVIGAPDLKKVEKAWKTMSK